MLPTAKTVKPEERSEDSAAKPCSPTAEAVEPVELDASATAIFGRSTTEIVKPAELQVAETAIATQLLSSMGAGNLIAESPSQPTGWQSQAIQAPQEVVEALKLVSNDTERVKPTHMPSQANTTKPAASDGEGTNIIGTSIEAMDLIPSAATTSIPITKGPSACTSPSTIRSTKTASSSNNSSSIRSESSAKRSAPTDTGDTLGSAQNPICLGSSPAPKRQRAAKSVAPRADDNKRGSWKVPIKSVGIMGLHLKPRHDDEDLSIVFDVETQRIVFLKGEQSLTELYPGLEINPDALLSVTRPKYAQSKQLKVRFMWLDNDVVETFLDILVGTKKECQELIAGLKDLTTFSEILLPEYVAPCLSFLY